MNWPVASGMGMTSGRLGESGIVQMKAGLEIETEVVRKAWWTFRDGRRGWFSRARVGY
jgi:hypothetical protein